MTHNAISNTRFQAALNRTDSSAYNLVFSGKFRPLLDIVAMKKAFALLFERHPLIDTTFVTRGGEPLGPCPCRGSSACTCSGR